MQVYIDLENLLKEKNISKNKVCEACKLQRTQLNNYCKNKVSRIDLTILAKLCDFLECSPNDILKLSRTVSFHCLQSFFLPVCRFLVENHVLSGLKACKIRLSRLSPHHNSHAP